MPPTTTGRVAKNTLWLFLGETLGRLIRFWIVIYAARVLGAAEYGVFSYALTIAAFATIFADIGISALLTREASRQPDQEQRLFNSGFVAKTVLIVVVAGLLLMSSPLLGEVPGIESLLLLIVAMFAFDSFREFAFGVLRAREAMHIEAIVKIVMNLFITGLGFWALAVNATAYALTLSYVIGAGIGCLGIFLLLHKNLRAFSLASCSFREVLSMIKIAWPIGILQILGAIIINTDMAMLGWWRSPEELGYYGASQKIILLLYVLPALLASAAFPSFARLAGNAIAAFKETFEKTVALSLGLALPMACGTAYLAREILVLLFGLEYVPATQSLLLLAGTLVFVFPSTIIANALFAHNKQRVFLWLSLATIIVNALGNAVLIPRFGIEGAALATLIANILSISLLAGMAKKTFAFSILPRLWRFCVACVSMLIALYGLSPLSLPTLALIGIGATSYVLVLTLLREPLLKTGYSLLLRR